MMRTLARADDAIGSAHAAERARDLYRELHRMPELSGRERETAALVAARLVDSGAQVRTRVGGHGVVGVLSNGPGPVVALRAELDGLAVAESTGLPYASDRRTSLDGRQVGVSHACGHDVHMAAVLSAVEHLAATRAQWQGTVLTVFQPAQESGKGAAAMVADGLFEREPAPHVLLAQHVRPDPLGVITLTSGAMLTSSVTLTVTVHGTGGHVGATHGTVDVVAVLLDLLATARDLASDAGVSFAVSAVHGGASQNTYPQTVRADVALRGDDERALDVLVESVTALARHVSVRSGCPRPVEVAAGTRFGPVRNDPVATERVHHSLVAGGVPTYPLHRPSAAGDDVATLVTAAGCPLVYWFIGAMDPDAFDADALARIGRGERPAGMPANHAPEFAPHLDAVVHATRALLVAAEPWLT